MSVVVALFGPTERVSGSSDPLDKGFVSPDPSDAGPALPDLSGKGSARSTPGGWIHSQTGAKAPRGACIASTTMGMLLLT
jgi:hypothetical protein